MNRMRPDVEMDTIVGPEEDGARRATGAVGPTMPGHARLSPRNPDRVSGCTCPAAALPRRSIGFASGKEADACKKPGEVGALLRREGLY